MAEVVNLTQVSFTDCNDNINFIIEEGSELKRLDINDLELNNSVSISLDENKPGQAKAINADTLGGIKASEYLRKNEVSDYINDISLPLSIENGGTGATNINEAKVNLGIISIDTLWQNASPDNDFVGQEISFDKIGYNFFIMIYCPDKYHNAYNQSIMFKNNSGLMMTSISEDENKVIYRSAIPADTGLIFNDAQVEGVSNNEYVVPLTIYGVKGAF